MLTCCCVISSRASKHFVVYVICLIFVTATSSQVSSTTEHSTYQYNGRHSALQSSQDDTRFELLPSSSHVYGFMSSSSSEATGLPSWHSHRQQTITNDIVASLSHLVKPTPASTVGLTPESTSIAGYSTGYSTSVAGSYGGYSNSIAGYSSLKAAESTMTSVTPTYSLSDNTAQMQLNYSVYVRTRAFTITEILHTSTDRHLRAASTQSYSSLSFGSGYRNDVIMSKIHSPTLYTIEPSLSITRSYQQSLKSQDLDYLVKQSTPPLPGSLFQGSHFMTSSMESITSTPASTFHQGSPWGQGISATMSTTMVLFESTTMSATGKQKL